jgi:hypothetical protein
MISYLNVEVDISKTTNPEFGIITSKAQAIIQP